MKFNNFITCIILLFAFLLTSSCKNPFRWTDARETPVNAKERVQKNLEEGRGIQFGFGKNKGVGGTFDFASSNELWRASLDTINFLPLISANYSGGIIISDWYSGGNQNESIKITIRFLTNEIRADALEIKVFQKKCGIQSNCTISENKGQIVKELKKNILKKAAIYEKELKEKNKKSYLGKIR